MTDLEFRVWDTYRWAADDFGVLPKSAAKLRGENDALRDQHTEDEVTRALQTAIDLDLITEFDHQGARYVCSLTWNEHQKIIHPRQTHLPCPPSEVLARMEVETRKLFKNFHDYFQKPAPSRARATRETANGKRQTANSSSGKETLGFFERFWGAYPRKVGKDAALAVWRRLRPDNDLTNRMIAAVHAQRVHWDDPKFIPHPRTWLGQGRWKDEAVTAPVVADQPDARGHFPPCESWKACTARVLAEARAGKLA